MLVTNLEHSWLASSEAGSFAVVPPNPHKGRNDYDNANLHVQNSTTNLLYLSCTDSADDSSSHLKHGLVLVGSAAPELVVDLEGPSVILILSFPFVGDDNKTNKRRK